MHRSRFISRAVLGALILLAVMPATALGISRDVVLARGKVWVDANTAYSQTRWAKVDGTLLPNKTIAQRAAAPTLGYRTDCSGYVSMCFALTNSKGAPLSLNTRTLSPSTVTTITKSAMLPGDVVLKPGSHVMVFVRWTDASQKAFKAYEEKGTDYGTVESTRTYSETIKWGYHLYRYRNIDDFYPDTQEAIYGVTRYDTGDAAVRVVFPAANTAPVGAVVLTNGETWTGNLGGAALAGATGGPLLLTSQSSLPAATYATIKRLSPKTVYVVGGTPAISAAVTDRIAKLGIKIVRTVGSDRYDTAARAAKSAVSLARANGRKVTVAYMVASNDFADGVAASAIAAKTARPIVLTTKTKVPAATYDALKKSGIKRVYVLGDARAISNAVVTDLRKHGYAVTRHGGPNGPETALLIARHGVKVGSGLSWNHVGIASNTFLNGTLACGVAQGQTGSLLLFTPGTSLYPGTAAEIARQGSGIGKVRVFGSYNVIGLPVRTSIADLMRAK